jgi:hypothetical protein
VSDDLVQGADQKICEISELLCKFHILFSKTFITGVHKAQGIALALTSFFREIPQRW